jgi:hypothetical protein
MNNSPAVITTPSPQSFDSMMRVAEMLASSDLVPAAYRRKPANVLVATLAGLAFGWDPTMSMRSFHTIDGTPSLKPEIMLALVRQAGHSVTGSTGVEGATVTGKRRDTGDEMTFTFGPSEAKAAGLSSGKNYQKYAASMYWARALSQLARMLFPDVVLGCGYVPEELGAAVSEDGTPITVSRVVVISAADAKRTLIEAAGGDVEIARTLWGSRGSSSIDPGELDALVASAAELSITEAEAEIVDAEIVEIEIDLADPEWNETNLQVAS